MSGPYPALLALILVFCQRCDGERPICQVCVEAKNEHLCFYEVVSVTKLLEENRTYRDKIQHLERALTLKESLAPVKELPGSSLTSSSNSNASSSFSEGPELSWTQASAPFITGT
jgi:hypothetical protein